VNILHGCLVILFRVILLYEVDKTFKKILFYFLLEVIVKLSQVEYSLNHINSLFEGEAEFVNFF